MKRTVGLLVGIAALGLLSARCSSKSAGPADTSGGASSAGAGAGGAAAALGGSSGAINVAGGGAAPIAGRGGTDTGGASGGTGNAGTGGAPGGATGTGGAPGGATGTGGAPGGATGTGGAPSGAGGGGSAGSAGRAATFADVQQIIATNCALTNCHASAAMYQNDLSATGLHGRLTSPMVRGQCIGTTLVVPNDPSASYILKVIQGSTTCGAGLMINKMPNTCTTNCLTDAQIAAITSWIGAGAPM